MLRPLSLLTTCLFFTAFMADADVIASPGSPPLVPAICGPAGLPPVTNPIWRGEMKPWVPGAGRPLAKIMLDPANGAVCNDGSPAAIYVRQAPASLPNGSPNPYRQMYHIHFKGGGSCRDFSSCKVRFCNGPKFTDKPGLMSSLGYVDNIEGEGLFEDRPKNRFSYANQVLAPYCSSDTWIGSTAAGTAHSIDPADDPADVSQIAFMGEAIVDEFLRVLDSGPTAPILGQNASYTMPPLSETRALIISGDSGGASGARSHLDRIARRYDNAFTIGAMDAGGAIDREDPRIDYTSLLATPSYEEMMKLRVLQARSFFGVQDSALDDSCVATITSSGPSQYPCFDPFQLQRDHITTPNIQRTSYLDSTAAGQLSALLSPPDPETLRALTFDGLSDAAQTNPNLSVLGANCARHVTFRDNWQVKRMRTIALGQTLYEELSSWAFTCIEHKSCPKIVHLAPPVPGPASVCP